MFNRGYDDESDSTSNSGKSEFDEEYYNLKPPSISVDSKQHNIIKIKPGQYNDSMFGQFKQLGTDKMEQTNGLSSKIITKEVLASSTHEENNDLLYLKRKFNLNDAVLVDWTPQFNSELRQHRKSSPVEAHSSNTTTELFSTRAGTNERIRPQQIINEAPSTSTSNTNTMSHKPQTSSTITHRNMLASESERTKQLKLGPQTASLSSGPDINPRPNLSNSYSDVLKYATSRQTNRAYNTAQGKGAFQYLYEQNTVSEPQPVLYKSKASTDQNSQTNKSRSPPPLPNRNLLGQQNKSRRPEAVILPTVTTRLSQNQRIIVSQPQSIRVESPRMPPMVSQNFRDTSEDVYTNTSCCDKLCCFSSN